MQDIKHEVKEPSPSDSVSCQNTGFMSYEEVVAKWPDREKAKELGKLLEEAAEEAEKGIAYVVSFIVAVGRKPL